MSEIAKYEAEGFSGLEVKIDEETVWLTQTQMSELFQKSVSTINEHIRNIFKENELPEKEVVKKFGNSEFSKKPTNFYSLDIIISVGYRVKSQRGTQFRRWATKILREHLLKGYTIKQPVSIEQLNGIKNEIQGLANEINELLKQQNKTDIFMCEEFGRVYEIIHELTEQKRQQEEKPRRKIGF
jgi:hypothetical protein